MADTIYSLSVYYNGDFYNIAPIQSCVIRTDYKKIESYFPPNIADTTLGKYLIDWFAIAKELTMQESVSFRDAEKIYNKWILETMERYNYKTVRAMLRKMQRCSVRLNDDTLVVMPNRHERLNAWGAEKEDEILEIALPVSAAPEILGYTLKEAFKRCSGIGADELFKKYNS